MPIDNYKAGNVPWRLPTNGPETCFVGISLHQFRTTQRQIVQSTLAQASSSEGEGFAIRGQGVPADADQRGNLHFSEDQAFNLCKNVLVEYEKRTGGAPQRMVVHKTTFFDQAEKGGFSEALRDIPIVEMVTLVPSAFRLIRFGAYPPKNSAAQDVLNLTRMNWNTADIRGKWPVTLSFARRVGGILDEYGEDEDEPVTSFRSFV